MTVVVAVVVVVVVVVMNSYFHGLPSPLGRPSSMEIRPSSTDGLRAGSVVDYKFHL